MSYNPLKFYRQVLRRLFLLYRHVIGLMVGGLMTYVNDPPVYKRKFFRAAGSRALEELINNSQRQENPMEVLRGSLMAGACIIGGVFAYVQDAPLLLWGGLFVSSVVFYFWVK